MGRRAEHRWYGSLLSIHRYRKTRPTDQRALYRSRGPPHRRNRCRRSHDTSTTTVNVSEIEPDPSAARFVSSTLQNSLPNRDTPTRKNDQVTPRHTIRSCGHPPPPQLPPPLPLLGGRCPGLPVRRNPRHPMHPLDEGHEQGVVVDDRSGDAVEGPGLEPVQPAHDGDVADGELLASIWQEGGSTRSACGAESPEELNAVGCHG